MLRAAHSRRYHLNHNAIVAVFIGKRVTTLRPCCGHSTLPHPQAIQHSSVSRRSLHLSSTAPITFPRSRDGVTFCLKDGTVLKQKFLPNPKARLGRLREALTELLQNPNSPPEGDEFWKWQQEKDKRELSFGTTEWHLDPEGDAIHRHTAHARAGELDLIENMIMSRADEMDHHPHITRGKSEGGHQEYMTITCTTHSPRGLSVRDTNLAKEINAMLSNFETATAPDPGVFQHPDEGNQKIKALREQAIAMNRDKINIALESCGCETAKSKPDTPLDKELQRPKQQDARRRKGGSKSVSTFWSNPVD